MKVRSDRERYEGKRYEKRPIPHRDEQTWIIRDGVVPSEHDVLPLSKRRRDGRTSKSFPPKYDNRRVLERSPTAAPVFDFGELNLSLDSTTNSGGVGSTFSPSYAPSSSPTLAGAQKPSQPPIRRNHVHKPVPTTSAPSRSPTKNIRHHHGGPLLTPSSIPLHVSHDSVPTNATYAMGDVAKGIDDHSSGIDKEAVLIGLLGLCLLVVTAMGLLLLLMRYFRFSSSQSDQKLGQSYRTIEHNGSITASGSSDEVDETKVDEHDNEKDILHVKKSINNDDFVVMVELLRGDCREKEGDDAFMEEPSHHDNAGTANDSRQRTQSRQQQEVEYTAPVRLDEGLLQEPQKPPVVEIVVIPRSCGGDISDDHSSDLSSFGMMSFGGKATFESMASPRSSSRAARVGSTQETDSFHEHEHVSL